MSFSLVAALGNPGRDYEHTRHNLGWIVLDAFARRHDLTWKSAPKFSADLTRWDRPGEPTLWLMKPLTFVNESGVAVGAFARFHQVRPTDIAIVYDDLTIDLGLLKVSVSGSAGGHNGVASLLEHVGDGFARYRLGIGPKMPAEMDLKDFVLGKFSPDQTLFLNQKLDQFVRGLDLLLSRGAEAAMNQLNRRDPI